MLLVVAYDVADDRRRARLRKLLLGYGVPVQESVVECDLTPEQAQELRQRAAEVIARRADRIAYYPLCQQCAAKVRDGAGKRRQPPPVAIVV